MQQVGTSGSLSCTEVWFSLPHGHKSSGFRKASIWWLKLETPQSCLWVPRNPRMWRSVNLELTCSLAVEQESRSPTTVRWNVRTSWGGFALRFRGFFLAAFVTFSRERKDRKAKWLFQALSGKLWFKQHSCNKGIRVRRLTGLIVYRKIQMYATKRWQRLFPQGGNQRFSSYVSGAIRWCSLN